MAGTSSLIPPLGGLRRCSKCKASKTIDHFYAEKRRPSGLSFHCKSCKKKQDQNRIYGRYQRGDEACDICGDRATDIDHDHLTGLTRGDLCRGCNSLLGWLETRAHLVEKAYDYLEGWSNGKR